MRTALTIAGFDPSSGAGMTADLMVFAAHGIFGTACITALTVQSTLGVAATHPVGPDVVASTLNHLHADLPPAGIKIGMLATPEIVEAVGAYLDRLSGFPIVLDPVLVSSSGRELLSPAGIALLRERLLPRATIVTPNIEELAALTGEAVTTPKQMAEAAQLLQYQHPNLMVLATGGHLDPPDDLLLMLDGRAHWLPGEHIATTSTHGTGCAFSSALLSNMLLGLTPLEAARAAKRYVAEAMRSARQIGHGSGPLHHLWPMRLL